ncbi:hypothetical protein QUB40_00140, partial [Microcoleus sp. AT9_A2]|uniref:hypothetical protein n=1 Tax=Microcoleus sp. AT9_A2 TaxID=2818624 RepID=UPI002FD5A80A
GFFLYLSYSTKNCRRNPVSRHAVNPKNRVSSYISRTQPKIVAETRFLATQLIPETGFLPTSLVLNQKLSQKPGFSQLGRQFSI